MPKSAAMNSVQAIEQQVKKLTAEELAEFRAWFLDYEWQAWDRQLERDVKAGTLDQLASKARSHHEAGRTKPL
jgi:hypothetical protein